MKQRLHSGPGIVIGIPTLGRPVPLDWALALKSQNPPINYNSVYQIVRSQEVGVARQAIAEFAVEKDAKYLFFLGDDVECPPHTLRQLIYRMEQDETIGVIGGVYCAKSDPSYPLVFRGNGNGSYWDWKIGEFFEVTGLGMDCTLIKVDVFKQMPKPWFKTVDTDQYIDGKNNAEAWTEDLYFFKQLAEHTKYKIYCEAGVICKHWDVYGNRFYGLPADSLPMRQRAVPKEMKRCLMVGPIVEITEKDDFEVVHVDTSEEATDYRIGPGQLPFDEQSFDWVIITKPGLDVNMNEYTRVLKNGGKISALYSPLICRKKLEETFPTGQAAGEYWEIKYPNVSNQTELQSQ